MPSPPPRNAPPLQTVAATVARPLLLLLGLVLVALNLRPALSSVSPLLAQITQSLGLSAAAAGLLTTAPVLCLGLFAPLGAYLGKRLGSERCVLWMLIGLACGLVLRGLGGTPGLFVGSVIAGANIGMLGVLLPGIFKRDFPRQAGVLTGLYTMALCLGAALAAGASVPLSFYLNSSWHRALAFWALPALFAALVWWPQTQREHGTQRLNYRVVGLWRDPLAWQITLYMGLQSSLAYIVFGWLPSLLIDRGLSPQAAGLLLAGSVMAQLVTALSAPYLATRGRDQRAAIAVVMLLSLTGLLGCLYAPLAGIWGWAIVLGLGQGGAFSLALALIVLRARDAQVAAQLSGMAQGVGYTLASLGPLAVGWVHDLTGSWRGTGLIFVVLALCALGFGMGAGRARYVQAHSVAL